jgi:hypothetical protein
MNRHLSVRFRTKKEQPLKVRFDEGPAQAIKRLNFCPEYLIGL